MLFLTRISFVTGIETPVVLGARLALEGQVSHVSYESMLGGKNTLTTMRRYGEHAFVDFLSRDRSGGNEPLPFVTTDGPSPQGTFDITAIWSLLMKHRDYEVNEDLAARIGNSLRKQDEGITNADSLFILTMCRSFAKYLLGEDKIKVEAPEITFVNPGVTIPLVKEHNAKLGPQFKYITSEINKTEFMENEDDHFFMELPTLERLRNEDVPMSHLLPSMESVFKPYPHPIYKTPFYEKVFSGITAEQRNEIFRNISDVVTLTPEDKSNITRIDFRRVKGYVENNDNAILPNEEDFYNALTELIKFDIAQKYPDSDVEENFKNGNCSERMLEFLHSLLQMAARYNWSHNNKFPILEEDDDDDESERSSDSESSEEFEPNYFFYTGEHPVSGMPILEEFVNMAQERIGLQAYVEAIIKLCRWGGNKPTALKLGDMQKYLDLTTLYIKSTSGDINALTPTKIDGIYDFSLRGVVSFEERYRDAGYKDKLGVDVTRIEIPVGLAVERHFGEFKQLVFMSMMDIISAYKATPDLKMIKGIVRDGNVFRCDIPAGMVEQAVTLREVATVAANMAQQKTHVIYESDAVKALKLDMRANNISSLEVLFEYLYSPDNMTKWGETLAFRTKEEFLNKITTNPMPKESYLKTNIALLQLPVVFKANSLYEDLDEAGTDSQRLALILTCYERAMDELGYVNEGQIFNRVEVATPAPVAQAESADDLDSRLARMGAFSGGEQKQAAVAVETPPAPAPVAVQAKQEDELVLGGESTPKEHPGILPIVEGDKVLSIMHGTEIIGGIAVRALESGKRVFIIGDKSVLPPNPAPSTNNLETLGAFIMDFIHKTLLGIPEESQVRFHSAESAFSFRNFFNDINKKK